MKKQLLLLILPILFFSAKLNAQTHVWNFSDSAIWPIAASSTTIDEVRDGLRVYAGGSAFAQVEAKAATFDDGFMGTQHFKTGGSSNFVSGTLTPGRRYLSFPVTDSEPRMIQVWWRTNGTGNRSVAISDGTVELGSQVDTANDTAIPLYFSAVYSGGAGGTIYIYAPVNAVNYFKIEVGDVVPLGLEDIASNVSTNVKAIGNRIYVSNVKLNTEVKIFSITGALVKSLKTNENMDFAFNSGLYIATVRTSEGQKSVKLLTR